MELLVVRHAHASSSAFDEERCLSPEGRRQAEIVGAALRRLGLTPSLILSSPLRRAMETARAVARGVPVEEASALRPGATPRGIVGFVAERAKDTDRVLIVGHQPDLGQLVQALTGAEITLPTAGVARIEIDRIGVSESGRLRELWSPDSLSLLAHPE